MPPGQNASEKNASWKKCLLDILCLGKKRLLRKKKLLSCLCMGELQAPPAPAAPHFVFLITL